MFSYISTHISLLVLLIFPFFLFPFLCYHFPLRIITLSLLILLVFILYCHSVISLSMIYIRHHSCFFFVFKPFINRIFAPSLPLSLSSSSLSRNLWLFAVSLSHIKAFCNSSIFAPIMALLITQRFNFFPIYFLFFDF